MASDAGESRDVLERRAQLLIEHETLDEADLKRLPDLKIPAS